MNRYPAISLCMIVKNEEDWLEQCLKSVRPIISEIIFVDTGSTDRSVEIARNFGAKIYTFEWTDDFSAARNFSLQQAAGDWIFVLDPDEAIAARDLKSLQEKTLAEGVCCEMSQRHYTNDHRLSNFIPCSGEFPEWERHYPGYFESSLCRLFPNHKGIHYRGRIHELVEHSIKEIPGLRIRRINERIHHYGHTPEVKRKKTKSEIYSPLGEAKTKEQPRDWKAYFELGVEHNCNGRHAESAEAFTKSVALNPDHIETWVNFGYVLCELGRHDEAENALKRALALNPDNEEAWCNLGVVCMRRGVFQKAAEVLIRAVTIQPKYVNALCNLGNSLVHLGRFSEAASAYYRAIEAMPHCVTAHADIGVLMLTSGELDEAERMLEQAVRLDPSCSRAFFNLSALYKRRNRRAEAADALEKFCEIEEKHGAAAAPGREAQIRALRQEIAALREGREELSIPGRR